jgi:hypothetical protein
MLNLRYLYLLIALLSAFSVKQYAQDINPIMAYCDSIYGADHFLITGRIYNFPNHNADGNPFLYGNIPKTATLMMKGKIYKDVQVNYNIEEDKLILITRVNKILHYIELNNSLIDSFYLKTDFSEINQVTDQYSSYNLINPGAEKHYSKTSDFINFGDKGFYELIFGGNILLVKKYSKKFFDRVSEDKKYGYYSSQNESLYIIKSEIWYNVTKKRDFINFSRNHKGINKYMKQKKICFNDATNDQLIELMNYTLSINE